MNNSRLFPSFLVAAAMTVLFLTAARANDNDTASIKFSDPTKPGTLKISVTNGDIHVHGTDAAEIHVTTDIKSETPETRSDGLRVLTSSSSYSLTEKNNLAVLSYGTEAWPTNGGGDFTITVPRNTAVIINSNYGGDVDIGGVTGNIEVKNLNGEVKLEDIDGAALVESMNGEIHATVLGLHEGKPLSFTSMNGEVTLHLPADAKANVRLRTHNGSILTDFDDKTLVTKTESIRVTSHSHNRAPKAVDSDVSNDINTAARQRRAREAAIAAAVEAAEAFREGQREAAREIKAAKEKDNDDDETFAHGSRRPVPPAASPAAHDRRQDRRRYAQWRRPRDPHRHHERRRDPPPDRGEEIIRGGWAPTRPGGARRPQRVGLKPAGTPSAWRQCASLTASTDPLPKSAVRTRLRAGAISFPAARAPQSYPLPRAAERATYNRRAGDPCIRVTFPGGLLHGASPALFAAVSSHATPDYADPAAPPRVCQNCGAPLTGPFCAACGQQDVDYHRGFHHLFHDLAENLFHFEGKFFVTVAWLLAKPGRITLEFIAGRRASQLNPLRFYIFVSVLFFLGLSLLNHGHLIDIPRKEVDELQLDLTKQGSRT